MKIRQEKRVVNGKKVRVTVVERKPTPEEQLEQRLAALEARVAALEKQVGPKQLATPGATARESAPTGAFAFSDGGDPGGCQPGGGSGPTGRESI